MTIGETLAKTSVDKTDAEILLANALGKDRTWILAHENDALDAATHDRFTVMIERRKNGEPVAYIIGTKEFFGREFVVNPSTLIPRPATELLVEQAIHVLKKKPVDRAREIDTQIVAWSDIWGNIDDVQLVVDIGTGSGCIAVTLACELPNIRIIATDISDEVLKTAQSNAEQHGVSDRITFLKGNSFEPLADIAEPFLIVSNPPYIPDGQKLEHSVRAFEPSSALFAGYDGADIIRSIVEQAKAHPFCRGFVMECREEQVT
jgi:release factor glutamine methyltransferase